MQSFLSADLIGLLCDVVRSVVCELFANQEHVTLMSLLKSFLLLTKTHYKVFVKGQNHISVYVLSLGTA